MRRVGLTGLSIVLVLACDRGSTEAKPTSTKAEVAEPKPKPEPEPEPKPKPGPKSATTVELAAGVPAPPQSAILAAAKPYLDGKLAIAAPPLEYGPGRYAIALRRASPEHPERLDLHVAILEAAAPDTPDATWSLVGRQLLHHWEAIDPDDPRVPTTLLAEDYDDDGELELLARFRLDIMCGGGGANEITYMILVDTEPEPTIALQTELHHAMGAAPVETEATVSHEDLDGDAHRDVRIRYVTRDGMDEDGEVEVQAAENRWLWQAASDTWALAEPPEGADGAPPSYARWGCDW